MPTLFAIGMSALPVALTGFVIDTWGDAPSDIARITGVLACLATWALPVVTYRVAKGAFS